MEGFGYHTGSRAPTINSGTCNNSLSVRVLDGNIMKSMSPSHTYFSSSESSLFRYTIPTLTRGLGGLSTMFRLVNKGYAELFCL
jgi:hypothetical protein